MALAVVRHLELHRWREILKEWKDKPEKRKHCIPKAPKDAVCPTNEKWWSECSCQPSAPFRHVRPIDGPVLFMVLKSNVPNWISELGLHVDLELLKVNLVVVHDKNSSEETRFTDELQKRVTTIRDSDISFPKNAAVNVQEMIGQPTPESNRVWILTTWQSAGKGIVQKLAETHSYKKRKEGIVRQTINRFHCGLAIVDEAHGVKNIGKGP